MNKRTNDFMNEEACWITARLDELCAGTAENEFDSWLRKRFYPVLAVGNLGVDVWLRERFYPVVALFTA